MGKGYATFWNFKGRYRIIKGSRGSKKSYTTALWYIYKMMELPDSNLLVVRKIGDTNKDSTYSQLKTAIKRLGVSHLWHISKSPMEIIYKPTGQRILFRGLDDPLKITSITVDVGHLCWVWFEEAYQIMSEDDFDKIDMSIRGSVPSHLFKQITVTFNPWSNKHWLNGRFFSGKKNDIHELKKRGLTIHGIDDSELVMTTNFKINEFLGEDDLKVYKKMEDTNPNRFMIEGVGEWGVSEGLIYTNWEEKAFDFREVLKEVGAELALGLDFGYTNDPSAFVAGVINVKKQTIHIFDEFYQKGLSNKKIADLIISKGYGKDLIVADSAEKKSIDQIKDEGVKRIIPADKGKDSILAGIQFLQDYKIYVHPKCVNTITELGLYCWVEDKTGKKLNKAIDQYNHLMDALRYAVERFKVKKRKPKSIDANKIL